MLSDDGAAMEQRGLAASLKGTYPPAADGGHHLFIRPPFYTTYRDLSHQVFGPWLPHYSGGSHAVTAIICRDQSFRTEHRSAVCS